MTAEKNAIRYKRGEIHMKHFISLVLAVFLIISCTVMVTAASPTSNSNVRGCVGGTHVGVLTPVACGLSSLSDYGSSVLGTCHDHTNCTLKVYYSCTYVTCSSCLRTFKSTTYLHNCALGHNQVPGGLIQVDSICPYGYPGRSRMVIN